MRKIMMLYTIILVGFQGKAQDRDNLYLISGHPYSSTDEEFASYLWQYSAGSLDTVALLSSKDDFLENVKVYPEQKLAIAHKTNSIRRRRHLGDNQRLVFIDYEDAIGLSEVTVDIEGIFQYFLSMTEESLLLDMFSDEKGSHFNKVDLADLSITEGDVKDFIHAKITGIPGGMIYGYDYMLVYTNERTGTMEIPLVGDRERRPKFPYVLPERYQFHVYERHLVPINNKEIFVLSGKDKKVKNQFGSAQLIIFDKIEQKWSDMYIPGDIVHPRGFSEWICGYAVNAHIEGETLPGAEKWTYRESGLSPKERWDYYPEYGEDDYTYTPGILYFYNARTKKYFQLETNQADSEVILVQGDKVVYRAYDELYAAEIIKGSKLGRTGLLLKDDRVPDIHWAFYGGN